MALLGPAAAGRTLKSSLNIFELFIIGNGCLPGDDVGLVAAVFYAPTPKVMTSEIDPTGPNTSPTRGSLVRTRTAVVRSLQIVPKYI